jgi:hypothetical protein
MLAIKELREGIRLGFASLQAYIRPGGSLNLTDINIHAEVFVGEILNALHSWNLVNTNNTTPNSPCIDLLEARERIGIQVTSQAGAAKLNKTLQCVRTHGLSTRMNQLKVFSLLRKQGTYKVTETCPGISFNWRQDVLDFDTTLQEINAITDLQRLRAIHSVVSNAFPTLFASRRALLQANRERLEKDLRIFDREVMTAPFHFEDPVLMYKAIREMRIALQQNGSSRVANSVAARNFHTAHAILRDTERQIRAKFPYIHDAAINDTPNVRYPNGAFSDSIQLMMQIRGPLQPLLKEIERELAAIDARL